MLISFTDATVLVIDDEPVVRESIAAYLEDSGFMVLQAENGRVGLEVFRNESPDIILVDLRMPEVDGLDVLAAVTQESPETPLIVVSGTGVLLDAIEALRLGAWDYITKPIQDMAILEHAVIKALERARLLVERRKYHENLEIEIGKRTAELEERTRELEIANEKLKKEIKERQQTEAQLRQAQKMEAIGTLAGGIAHDFNNILFPIFGYTEMLMDETPEDSKVKKYLKGIMKAARRAKDLVNQILTFSHKGDEEQKPLNIKPIIKESLKLLKSTLPATIEIQKDIQNDCGNILANPTQIHQIIMNLCTNSYHAMREKGGVLKVSLKEIIAGPEDIKECPELEIASYLKLTVRDTGVGMTREIMGQIFDPYFTTKEVGDGTGLGLFVVYGIVKNHRGQIVVQSEPDKGTTIHIFFPIFAVGDPPLSINDSDAPVPGGNERILLIDDEAPIIDMEKQMLENLGYHVIAFTNSLEALEIFKRQPDDFDLIITDSTMPRFTGVELAREITCIRPDIPIILSSGYSEMITKEKAKAIGVSNFIRKPMLRIELATIIRQVLDKKTSTPGSD